MGPHSRIIAFALVALAPLAARADVIVGPPDPCVNLTPGDACITPHGDAGTCVEFPHFVIRGRVDVRCVTAAEAAARQAAFAAYAAKRARTPAQPPWPVAHAPSSDADTPPIRGRGPCAAGALVGARSRAHLLVAVIGAVAALIALRGRRLARGR
jgi:hypothetical protein